MTSTNRAFIKAYRRDAAEAVPPPLVRADHSRPTANLAAATVEYVSAVAVPGAMVVETASPAALFTADSSKPRAHSSPVGVGDPLGPPRPSATGAASGKRPLSSFAVPRHTHKAATVARAEPAFQPGTTISSFDWPDVCRALWRHSNNELNELTDVLLANGDDGLALIGMMGLFPGRGCSTLLLALAAPLAARGRRVAVVDGSFFRPHLAGLLGVEPLATWHDVLSGGTSVDDAVIRSLDDGVDLLPMEARLCDARQLAGGAEASITADWLRNAYDLALLDLGAFFDPESQPVALELVRNMRLEAVLAVAGPQSADPRDLATLAEYLDSSDCGLLGSIENRVADPRAAAKPRAAMSA